MIVEYKSPPVYHSNRRCYENVKHLIRGCLECYEDIYDAIVKLANHPDDDNCAMWEAITHRDYDDAMVALVLAHERARKEARDRGYPSSRAPSLDYSTSEGYISGAAGGSGKGPSLHLTVAAYTKKRLAS